MDDDEVIDAFTNALPPDPIVWDVGAYKGTYTEHAITQNAKAVHAFEPEPTNLATLYNRFHDTTSVTIHPIALYSENTYGSLEANDGGPSTWAFTEETGLTPAVSMDHAATKLGYPDAIKVDVEGAEGPIINAAEETLAEVSVVLVEIHDSPVASTACHAYGYTPRDIKRHLERNGLNVTQYGSGNTYHYLATK